MSWWFELTVRRICQQIRLQASLLDLSLKHSANVVSLCRYEIPDLNGLNQFNTLLVVTSAKSLRRLQNVVSGVLWWTLEDASLGVI